MLRGTFSYSILKGQCSLLNSIGHLGLLSHHALAVCVSRTANLVGHPRLLDIGNLTPSPVCPGSRPWFQVSYR